MSTHHDTKNKLYSITHFKCIICDDDIKKGEEIVFHKTRRQYHSMCIDCTVSFLKPILALKCNNIRKNMRLNAAIINCPGTMHSLMRNVCKHKISLLDLKIPECPLLLDILRISTVILSDKMILCINQNCGQVIEIDPMYIENNISCLECKTNWCRQCMISPFHTGKTCIQHEMTDNTTENGKFISESIKNGILKYCPSCSVPTIKHNGCNKMYCSKEAGCGFKWCWLCDKIGIDYDHYSKGLCSSKLWQGTDTNL